MNALEKTVTKVLTEELSKKDVLELIKKDGDVEKRVKKIVSDVLVDMFRVLWMHNNLFKSLGK